MDMTIRSCPQDAYNYEFIVVKKDGDDYVYHSHYTSGFLADKIASQINGVIIHNVRIQGVRRNQKDDGSLIFDKYEPPKWMAVDVKEGPA